MKKYILALISFILGASCFVAYSVIGSEVAPDGALVEPFFLIPVGYLLIAIAIIIPLIVTVLSFFRNPKTR